MLLPRSLPGYRTRRQSFEKLVIYLARRLITLWPQLSRVDFAIEDIPPVDPSPWEKTIALAKLFAAESGYAPRIVLYRRPILDRASDELHLRAIVHELLVEQAAIILAIEPQYVDPDYDLER